MKKCFPRDNGFSSDSFTLKNFNQKFDRDSPRNENKQEKQFNKLYIAIVSDFFVPNLGGVEMHMYNIS